MHPCNLQKAYKVVGHTDLDTPRIIINVVSALEQQENADREQREVSN